MQNGPLFLHVMFWKMQPGNYKLKHWAIPENIHTIPRTALRISEGVWGSSKYDRELNVVTCIFQTTLTQHGGHKVASESEAEKGSVLVT